MSHTCVHRVMRGAIVAIAITMSSHPLAAQQTMAPPPSTGALASTPIHQEVEFPVAPAKVYEALLDAKEFAAFSGRPAVITRTVGGAFSLFSAHIIGRNVELVPGKRIVQAWRVVDWPEGIWSIVRFDLEPRGTGTHLVFDHTGFPADQRDHLAAGWDANYWSLMRKQFH